MKKRDESLRGQMAVEIQVRYHIELECPLSDPKSTIAETGMGVTSGP